MSSRIKVLREDINHLERIITVLVNSGKSCGAQELMLGHMKSRLELLEKVLQTTDNRYSEV